MASNATAQTPESLKNLYHGIKAHSSDTEDAIRTTYRNAVKAQPGLVKGDEEQYVRATKLLRAVVTQVSESEFIDWQTKDIIPTVKLTPEQMERVRGGFWGTVAVASVVYAWWQLENS